ncbi:hypothetical protein [Fructobacillus cardui]|uniref:hypothetical protein n=1 Tax=Fructobacillus cardui TaxID=2893170 RepID=UPI00200B65EE|nr:hypothetical protein [Fructobacillus cardui]MCK8626760.1 hypothetical protein [Fructobacillus cardui]
MKKLTILLDVNAVQDWYNGGFEPAPKWYQDHIAFIKKPLKSATLSLRSFSFSRLASVCYAGDHAFIVKKTN